MTTTSKGKVLLRGGPVVPNTKKAMRFWKNNSFDFRGTVMEKRKDTWCLVKYAAK